MEHLEIVQKLLKELNDNITYCHWKSNQHFINALKGIDDLDILVDRNQSEKLIQILTKLNFKHFYTPVARTYVGVEDYLGFDDKTGNIVHLHLHYQLVVGEKHLKGFNLPFEKYIFDNRRWNEEMNVYMSSYFDELLLLILRMGMKNRKRDIFKRQILGKDVLKEFEWLKQKCPDFEEKLDKIDFISKRIKEVLKNIYRKKYSWYTLRKLKYYLYHDFACFSQGSGLYNTIKRNLHELSRVNLEIRKRYIPSSKYTFLRRRVATGGSIIAFLGSDGAGKSTSIKEILDWLKKVMDVRYFYLGSGDGNSSLLRKPLKIIKCLAQKLKIIKVTNNFNDEEKSKNEKADSKSLSIARRLWIYTLSKERIRKLIQVNRCRTRGYIVLTDRYPQSEFNGLCDGPKLKNVKGIASKKEKEAYRIAKLCPPDVVIKLIVSPEVAAKRKPGEIDLEVSKNLTERVKKIKFSDKTKSILIDADKPQQDVILEIKKAIWNSI